MYKLLVQEISPEVFSTLTNNLRLGEFQYHLKPKKDNLLHIWPLKRNTM